MKVINDDKVIPLWNDVLLSNKAEFKMRKFNMKMLKNDLSCFLNHNIIYIIGDKKSGKSTLIKDILYHHQFIPSGIIISPKEEEEKIYNGIIPDLFIHHEYTLELTEEYSKQKKKMKKKMMKEEDPYEKYDLRTFLVMDDCINDKKLIMKDKFIREFHMNGRGFWSVFLIMTLDFKISPNLSANCDNIFFFKELCDKKMKKLYENYLGYYDNISFDFFNKLMDSLEEYECLVIDKSSRSHKLEDQIFWYKAEEHNNFKTCCEEAWNYIEEKK